MTELDKMLEIALNPIGSLALRERLEANSDKLIAVFNALVSSAVTLTLSPNGYRIVECFLNANIDDVNVRLADSLSAEWEGLKRVLQTAKGLYICETLLGRCLKTFAHRIITTAPKDWWFKEEMGLQSLHILIKAIDISEVEVANQFCSQEQMPENLCDSPEGLYCLLKVKKRSMKQPGWKHDLRRLILLKAKSISGSEALVQVLVYGDYMVLGIVAMIYTRRESFDDSTTVSLMIRLIELGGIDLKQFIFDFLVRPKDSPMICRVRFSVRFDDFKRACDANFTPAQRNRLDECLATDRIESRVDECLKLLPSQDAPAEPMDTTAVTKKRRIEQPTTSDNLRSKKPREEVQPAVDSRDETPAATATVPMPNRPPPSSNNATLGSASTPARIRFDPGVDVVSMAMGEKSREILAELKFGSADYRSTIFECIQNGLLALMMDERGSEVVKWFIVNGCFQQNGTVERRVMDNVEHLVKSGAYGRSIVQTTIDECTNYTRKEELGGMFGRAMIHHGYSADSSLTDGFNSREEIEMISENVDTSPDQETTVAKVSEEIGASVSLPVAYENQSAEVSPGAIPSVSQELSAGLHDKFNEIARKLKDDKVLVEELKNFADFVEESLDLASFKHDARRQVFIDLISGSISSWSETEKGMTLIRMLACKQSLRAMMVHPIASILHKLGGSQGEQVLAMVLSNQMRGSFIHCCLSSDDSSPFAKMFRSDMDKYQCASIGMNILARAEAGDRDRIRAFLTRFGRSIGATEKGRVFIVMVADSYPMGWNWTELLDLLPPPPVVVDRPSPSVAANWDCPSCWVGNKATDVKCACCGETKPANEGGAAASGLVPPGLENTEVSTEEVDRPKIVRRESSREEQDSGRATGDLASSLLTMDNSATISILGSMLDANQPYEFEVPNTLVGLLIGTGGKSIKELRTRADVQMQMRKHHETAKADTHQICEVRGTSRNIHICLQILRKRFPPLRYPELNLEPVLQNAATEEEAAASGLMPPELDITNPARDSTAAVEKQPVKGVSPSVEDEVDGGAIEQESSTEEQTPLPLPVTSNQKSANDGSQSRISFSFASQNKTGIAPRANPLFKNPFRLNRSVNQSDVTSSSHLFPSLPPPRHSIFAKSAEIGVSSSGAPAFPTPRRLPAMFSFKQAVKQSLSSPVVEFSFKNHAKQLSFASFVTETIVKDTLEYIVKTVAEANP